MTNLDETSRSLAETEAELAALDARRADLLARIAELQQEKAALLPTPEMPLQSDRLPSVTNQSSQESKIALFRRLFRGREDVYPKRFESVKTGKKGYQPVCGNEWVDRGAAFEAGDGESRHGMAGFAGLESAHPLKVASAPQGRALAQLQPNTRARARAVGEGAFGSGPVRR